jgi:hypothetical protein
MSGKYSYDISATLTADGTSTGYATVPGVQGFYVGATVFLTATGLPTMEGVITEVKGNLIGFRTKGTLNYGNTNISPYTVAAAAAITQPAQYVNTDNTPSTLEQATNGADEQIGVIVATTTPKTNGDTATPFPVVPGNAYSFQPDAECKVASGTSIADVTAKLTAGKGTRVEANALYDRPLPRSHSFVGVVAIAGTVNCAVNEIIH